MFRIICLIAAKGTILAIRYTHKGKCPFYSILLNKMGICLYSLLCTCQPILRLLLFTVMYLWTDLAFAFIHCYVLVNRSWVYSYSLLCICEPILHLPLFIVMYLSTDLAFTPIHCYVAYLWTDLAFASIHCYVLVNRLELSCVYSYSMLCARETILRLLQIHS